MILVALRFVSTPLNSSLTGDPKSCTQSLHNPNIGSRKFP
ncbi:hypothetical protein MJ1HA_2030 [Metallosphaera sedula]|nr:hypothetical protein MJ1HA_2030 [Metallosphaera sedula]